MHNVPLPQDNLESGGRGRAARHVRHAVYVNGTALRPQPRTQIQVALALFPVSFAFSPQGPAPVLRNKLEVQFNLRNLDASSLCKTCRRRGGIPPKSVCRAFTWKWSLPLPPPSPRFCIYNESTPRPSHSHPNGTLAIRHFNVTRGKRRENGCIPGSIAASGRWIKDCKPTDRPTRHPLRCTYLRVPSNCLAFERSVRSRVGSR